MCRAFSFGLIAVTFFAFVFALLLLMGCSSSEVPKTAATAVPTTRGAIVGQAAEPAKGASKSSPTKIPWAELNGDLRYMLVRHQEKNYYELSRAVFILGHPSLEEMRKYEPSAKHYGFDVITDRSNVPYRYGVYQAWKVRLVATSDTQKAPASTKDSVYVLMYLRNPDWIFCATKYSVVETGNGARKLIYSDFQNGHEYSMELSAEWPRPWQIYELEILNSNAFVEILEAELAAAH